MTSTTATLTATEPGMLREAATRLRHPGWPFALDPDSKRPYELDGLDDDPQTLRFTGVTTTEGWEAVAAATRLSACIVEIEGVGLAAFHPEDIEHPGAGASDAVIALTARDLEDLAAARFDGLTTAPIVITRGDAMGRAFVRNLARGPKLNGAPTLDYYADVAHLADDYKLAPDAADRALSPLFDRLLHQGVIEPLPRDRAAAWVQAHGRLGGAFPSRSRSRRTRRGWPMAVHVEALQRYVTTE